MPCRYECVMPPAPGMLMLRGIVIPPARVLRVMGYRDSAGVRAPVRRTAEAMAELAGAAAAPAAAWRRVVVAGCSIDGLVLSDGTTFGGPTFAAYLSGCHEAAVFVLSLGGRFDSTQKNLAASERPLEAYMLEIAGWIAIEEATRRFRSHLEQEAGRDGFALTRRLAPGYSSRIEGRKVEWPLEDQPRLFSLFDEADLPARLFEGGCTMTPKMSRSGLYGLRLQQ